MKPVDHYETLGVARDCSDAELKKAWRKAASAAHPDREGGSTEHMAAVNAAYDALIDPVKRIRYDTTGESDFKADALARDTIASLFAKFLDEKREVDIVAASREALEDVQHNIDQQVNELHHRLRRVKSRGPRFKVSTKATNLATLVIDRIVADCNARLGALKQDREATSMALKLLADYAYELPVTTVRRPSGSMTVGEWQRQTDEFWANNQR